MLRNYALLADAVTVIGRAKQTGRSYLPPACCSPGPSVLGVVRLQFQDDKRNRHGMGVPDTHPWGKVKGKDGLSLPLQPQRIPCDTILGRQSHSQAQGCVVSGNNLVAPQSASVFSAAVCARHDSWLHQLHQHRCQPQECATLLASGEQSLCQSKHDTCQRDHEQG